MTIRYTCHSCGSKLNIRDELAGSAGKCPQCKTEFAIPKAAPAEKSDTSPATAKSQAIEGTSGEKRRSPKKAKMPLKAAARRGSGKDEDFDPVAFLMEDEAAPTKRPSSPPLSDDEIPVALELDVSDEEPPRRRSRPRRRVNLDDDEDVGFGSASASAGAMLSGGASAGAARDLLTRTVEESRARAARIEDEEPSEPSVALEVGKEVIRRGLPGLLGVLVLVLGAYYFASSLVGGGIALPELGEVSGTVTLDGKPLAGARIIFRPVETEYKISDQKRIRVRPSTATTDADGEYELRYMEGYDGAAVGHHFVSISKREGPKELAPASFGPLSRESRIVKPGSQVIDFELESDAPR